MLQTATECLVRIGLTQYEAKVYAALVGLGEGTVREIHETSGVPRPRVYDILEGLGNRGFVEANHGTPMCYRAVEPNMVMLKLREDFESSSKLALEGLDKLNIDAVRRVSPVWYVKGDWSIRSRLDEMIARTNQELLIFVMRPALLRGLAPGIAKVAERKKVTCILTDGAKYLVGALGQTDLREIRKIRGQSQDDTFPMRVLMQEIDAGNARYRAEGIFLIDSKESMMVYDVNGERMAVMVELPILTSLQKGFLTDLTESSIPVKELRTDKQR